MLQCRGLDVASLGTYVTRLRGLMLQADVMWCSLVFDNDVAQGLFVVSI